MGVHFLQLATNNTTSIVNIIHHTLLSYLFPSSLLPCVYAPLCQCNPLKGISKQTLIISAWTLQLASKVILTEVGNRVSNPIPLETLIFLVILTELAKRVSNPISSGTYFLPMHN